jgi:hypothetical protein
MPQVEYKRAPTHRNLYEAGGLGALAARSHRPACCPHQIPPELEARICELRRQHPGWGPRRIEHHLDRAGIEPVPSRSSISRCLRRHGLIDSAVAGSAETSFDASRVTAPGRCGRWT